MAKFSLRLRWISPERGGEAELLSLPQYSAPESSDNPLSLRAQAAIDKGYKVFYVIDTIIIKVNSHYVADLIGDEKHAQWLLLDDDKTDYPWQGDAIIVRGDLTPYDFDVTVDPYVES
jgi:hypothetical protein